MNPAPPRPPPSAASLCVGCRHVQTVTSARGSTFYLCTRSRTEARYPKYPPQPVRSCPGYAAREGLERAAPDA